MRWLLTCLALSVILTVAAMPTRMAAQEERAAETREITVVLNNFRPYGYMDEKGDYVGFGVDIIEAIAERAGFELRYVEATSVQEGLELFAAGQADVHPSLADLPSRRALLSFTDAYDVLQVVVFRMRGDGDEESAVPLDGQRIGFNRGSIADFAVRQLDDVVPVPIDGNDALFIALTEGRIDAAAYPRKVFERIARAVRMEDRFRQVGEPLREIALRIAVDRDQPELLERIERELRTLRAGEGWTAIRSRWFPPPPPFWNPQRIMAVGTFVFVVLGLMAAFMILRQRDIDRNRLLRESEERASAERALAEQQAEANRQLVRHNREMQSILYVVSHDLKSPLVSIGGFARKAGRYLDRNEPEACADALARVSSNVETMGKLIDGILSISRLGRESLTLKRIDWRGLEERLRRALASDVEASAATLVVERPLPALTADPTQLYSVIQNLVSNALRHGCRHPGMTVRIVGMVEGPWTWIGVIDEGPGIEPQYHDRIFGLFQRLDVRASGSGIGLASVRAIAERHGGAVRLRTAPGEGAEFWIVLPTEPTDRERPSSAAPPAAAPTLSEGSERWIGSAA
ncbi:MAG: transporter substrate-binding domain-containing protein [Pseudomonadota bacterium]